MLSKHFLSEDFKMNFYTCSAIIEANIILELQRSKLRHSDFTPLALGNTDGLWECREYN